MTALETLKQKFADAWLKLCVNLHERLPEKDSTYLYGLLGATALAPALNEPVFAIAVAKLTEVVGALGIEAMGGLLEEFRNKKDETERTRLLQQTAENSAAVRAVLDDLLEKVDALPLAQKTFNQSHSDKSAQQRFVQALQQSLQQVGSRLKIPVRVRASKGAAAAFGPKAKARVENLTAKGKKAKNIVAKRGGVAANKIVIKNKLSAPKISREEQLARQNYLNDLRNECNRLPLTALAEDRDPHQGAAMSLNQIYVDLNTTTPQFEHSIEKKRAAEIDFEKTEKAKPVTALTAACKNESLVILGDPGSGKSSFTNHLLYLCAGYLLDRKKNNLPKGWPPKHLVPVRVVLRHFNTELQNAQAGKWLDLPMPERDHKLVDIFLAHLDSQLKENQALAYTASLRASLLAGDCFIVLDGLDEVPIEQRNLLRRAIEALRYRLGSNRYIITCRIRSWDDKKPLPAFQVCTLAPFTDDQVKQFVRLWYGALQETGHFSKSQAGDRIASMLKAIGVLERLLVQNPLLLTTMAVVHYNDTDLPRERVKLYRRAAEVLLKRWQQHRAGRAGLLEAVGINDRELYPALRELAFFAQNAGQTQEAADIPRENALQILERHFAALEKPDKKALAFLEYIDETAGILIGKGGTAGAVYAFPHRTFQEYFAGTYLTRTSNRFEDEIKSRLPQGDYWQVAVGLGLEDLLHHAEFPRPAFDAAYALCPTDELAHADEAHWRGVLWSAQFALAIGKKQIEQDAAAPGGQSYLHRLTKRLIEILNAGLLPARERADAGFTLGRLGDEREGVCTLPPVWVELPGGKFVMGSEDGEDREKPPHEVQVSPFKISKYPITNAQFKKFMQAGGYNNKDWWSEEGWKYRQKENWEQPRLWENEDYNLPNQPVVGVSWFEAEAFCAWLSKRANSKEQKEKGKQIVRLPTEAEWEFAARGKEGRKYPWGSQDEPTPEHANYDQSQINRPTAVGTYRLGATSEGIFDLAGNVWEWCLDFYDTNYYTECKKNGVVKNPFCAKENWGRVLRGGVWYSDVNGLRGSGRLVNLPGLGGRVGGFRVCVAGGS